MKCCGIACGAIGLSGVLCFLSGYALEKDFTLATSATIEAPPQTIFPTFNSQQGIQEWWDDFGKEMQKSGVGMPPVEVIAHDGPKAGKGAKMDFAIDGTLTESWEILESVPNEKVVYRIDFKVMNMVVERTITLEPQGSGTKVTWSEAGELENPMLRWVPKLSGDDAVKNFDMALGGVKRIAEGK